MYGYQYVDSEQWWGWSGFECLFTDRGGRGSEWGLHERSDYPNDGAASAVYVCGNICVIDVYLHNWLFTLLHSEWDYL
jgi:hypothetical protein